MTVDIAEKILCVLVGVALASLFWMILTANK